MLPYSGKFSYGANFRIFRMLHPLYENLNMWFFSSARDLWTMPHAVASAAADDNDVSILILCWGFKLFANGSSPNTLVDMVASHHRFNREYMRVSLGIWKAIGRGLASDQLRVCIISHCKHTKLKNTKIYSKGALVNHTKISTNKNFPLYIPNPYLFLLLCYFIP